MQGLVVRLQCRSLIEYLAAGVTSRFVKDSVVCMELIWSGKRDGFSRHQDNISIGVDCGITFGAGHRAEHAKVLVLLSAVSLPVVSEKRLLSLV